MASDIADVGYGEHIRTDLLFVRQTGLVHVGIAEVRVHGICDGALRVCDLSVVEDRHRQALRDVVLGSWLKVIDEGLILPITRGAVVVWKEAHSETTAQDGLVRQRSRKTETRS